METVSRKGGLIDLGLWAPGSWACSLQNWERETPVVRELQAAMSPLSSRNSNRREDEGLGRRVVSYQNHVFMENWEAENFKKETCDPEERCGIGDRRGLRAEQRLCLARDRHLAVLPSEHRSVLSPCCWKDSRCSRGLVHCGGSISSSRYSRKAGRCCRTPHGCSRRC